MVDSLSVSKTKPSFVESDDSEAVACMAAIAAYLAIEADEQIAANNLATKQPTSGWREASLLEGTQNATNYSFGNGMPLWRNFLGAFALAALSLLGTSSNSSAESIYNE